MRWTTLVGGLLILVGVIVLAWDVLPGTERRHEVEAGPVEMRVEEQREAPAAPIWGVVAVAAGLGVILIGRGRGAA